MKNFYSLIHGASYISHSKIYQSKSPSNKPSRDEVFTEMETDTNRIEESEDAQTIENKEARHRDLATQKQKIQADLDRVTEQMQNTETELTETYRERQIEVHARLPIIPKDKLEKALQILKNKGENIGGRYEKGHTVYQYLLRTEKYDITLVEHGNQKIFGIRLVSTGKTIVIDQGLNGRLDIDTREAFVVGAPGTLAKRLKDLEENQQQYIEVVDFLIALGENEQ